MNGQQPYHQNVGSVGNQNDTYNWQRHAHTVPQTNRGGRRLPQTPNVPSTLNKTNQHEFGAIDPRYNLNVPGNANSHSNSYSQPNLLNRFTSGVPSILGSTKTKSIDESIVSGTSNFFSSISNTVMGNHVNQGGGVVPGGMQHNQHTNQQQHRRLPATPNKPSTLFSQISTSTGFKSISNQINSQITKPSTLAFRQTTNIALKESPIYSAFSFPKLNGSPSSRPIAPGITAMTGFVGPNANHITNLTPGSSGTGSGTGFMGFGPTGFTTPIDTVLDRFGRTGTIFPVTTMGGGSHHPNNIGMVNYGGMGPNHGMNGIPPSIHTNGMLPSNGQQPHRTLPSMIPFGRSNSLGRSLPPVPSGVGAGGNLNISNNKATIKPGPILVRRRTFEDESDQRTDWI